MATILIIEDHEVALSLCKAMLGESHNIIEAKDTDSALKLLRMHKPELVIADLMVPNSEGFFPTPSKAIELISHLRAINDKTKIVVYSVLCYEPEVSKQAFAFGANACLLKMGDVETFRKTINSLLSE